ncbi:MAG: hypothetical protein ABWK00_04880 [Desulfurococcaceae archaeon]
MPIRYVCRRCGATIYEFKKVGQDCYGIPSPEEVYRLYGGICPYCKSTLTLPTLSEIRINVLSHKFVMLTGPRTVVPAAGERLSGVVGA